jgi:hypothetical protein
MPAPEWRIAVKGSCTCEERASGPVREPDAAPRPRRRNDSHDPPPCRSNRIWAAKTPPARRWCALQPAGVCAAAVDPAESRTRGLPHPAATTTRLDDHLRRLVQTNVLPWAFGRHQAVQTATIRRAPRPLGAARRTPNPTGQAGPRDASTKPLSEGRGSSDHLRGDLSRSRRPGGRADQCGPAHRRRIDRAAHTLLSRAGPHHVDAADHADRRRERPRASTRAGRRGAGRQSTSPVRAAGVESGLSERTTPGRRVNVRVQPDSKLAEAVDGRSERHGRWSHGMEAEPKGAKLPDDQSCDPPIGPPASP